MSILNDILKRRSVYPHQYLSETIPDKDINALLELANWAPTHRKTEPWRFKVFSRDYKDKLAEFCKTKYVQNTDKPSDFKANKILDKFGKSSHIIAVCMQRDINESVPEWEEIASTAMAVQNMWLGAANFGIGMYWSTPKYKDNFGEFVSLDKGEKCLGFLYVGRFLQKLPLLDRYSSIEDKTIWYSHL